MNGTSLRHRISRLAIRIAVCIVAISCCSCTSGQDSAGLTTIAKWDFGQSEDSQADRWPDGWTRRRDRQYPGFIPARIDKKSVEGVEEADAEQLRRFLAKVVLGWRDGRSPWAVVPETIPKSVERFVEQTLLDPYFAIEMDGSAAEVYSPAVPVHDDSLYGLQLDLRSNSSQFEPTGRLRFLDSAGQLLGETTTPTVDSDDLWHTVRTPAAYEAPPGVAFIQVALSVVPRARQSFRGSYGFDRIRVVQMPKIKLHMDRVLRVYRPGEKVLLRLLASGLKQGALRVELSLTDHNGIAIDCESKELTRVGTGGNEPLRDSATIARWQGSCEWQLPPLQPGYYELSAQIKRAGAVFFERRESFAVLAAASTSEIDPRFGWTFDESVFRWKLDDLLAILQEGRAGHVKLPIWFDVSSRKSQEIICETVDRIHSYGIHCVGILEKPIRLDEVSELPASVSLPAASLEDPNLWQPLLEPVFRAMCVRLVDFQIGFDNETKYASNPRFTRSIDLIRSILRRYGSESTLTLAKSPWSYLPLNPNIDRWQWTDPWELAESEWDLSQQEPSMRNSPWTGLNPISADSYALPTRTKDFAARILASIRSTKNAPSVGWISDPFSDRVGFLSRNGTPREMFVPYRTLLDAIHRKTHAGELQMHHGCRNALLVSDSACCLIVWSAHPMTEQLYLGESVDAIDIWGRRIDIQAIQTPYGIEHKFEVGKWPIILRGVDSKVAQWRMGLRLDQQRLDSLIGLIQNVDVQFDNPFPFSVSGRIELIAPQILANASEGADFDIDANSSARIPIEVLLRADATSQDTEVRVLANINGSPAKQFSVLKTLRIGNDDVDIETSYRISQADELWLELDAINHTDEPVSFDCQIFASNRRSERVLISNVIDRKTRTAVLPRASELIGQTLWLRCMQIGTRRILNYRIPIEAEAPVDVESQNDSEASDAAISERVMP